MIITKENCASGVNPRANSHVQSGNATFTLPLGFDPATGQYLDTPIQTKTFGSLPAVSSFHDSMGYYPGIIFNDDGSIGSWGKAASMVLPAKGSYSTRIIGLDRQPLLEVYGASMGGGQILGSGNPENTTFYTKPYYDKTAKGIRWEGKLRASEERTFVFLVKINKTVSRATVITRRRNREG